MKSSNSCCSKTAPQHDAATSVLHSWYAILSSTSVPLFPPNVSLVIMATQDMSPEVMVFVLVSFCKLIWLFYVSLGVMASFSLSALSGHGGVGHFTVDNDTFLPASSQFVGRSEKAYASEAPS